MSTQKITNFSLEANNFLANIYPERINFTYGGIEYHNIETAYQSQKLEKESDRRKVAYLNPEEAKSFARGLPKRRDWEKTFSENDPRRTELCICLKDVVMYELLEIKFKKSKECRLRLVATNDAEIVKENNVGEIYWGKCSGIGQNKIGRMMMDIRSKYASPV